MGLIITLIFSFIFTDILIQILKILLVSNTIKKILLPINNRKIKKFFIRKIVLYRINFFKILKKENKIYKKILHKKDLLDIEIKFLNLNL